MSTRNIVLVDGIILLRKMLETIVFQDSYNRNQLIVEVKRSGMSIWQVFAIF